ncbi:MAG: DNA adenine methylase [Endomicrobia bacterium]|nr:DNA adenine methylase [Endomicrobiia bacterium]
MFAYIGGKYYLANWIIENFPENYQKMTYVEVFGGAGWVLTKKQPSTNEVYNDLDKNLYNIFYCLKYHRKELLQYFKYTIYSREFNKYYKEKLLNNSWKDDVERAFGWLYLRASNVSGHLNAGFGFAKDKDISRVSNLFSIYKRIIKFKDRFQKVCIENLDFEECIKKYDGEHTLFYLDPPYLNKEHNYNIKFTKNDHIRLANILKTIRGKFLLSYYDLPEINDLYSDFYKKTKTVPKHGYYIPKMNTAKFIRPKAIEILISNYIMPISEK